MSKFAEINPRLLCDVVHAVETCWHEGSPVAGSSLKQWRQLAHVALRRIRSFDRRNIADGDHAAQVRDIARGFVAAFEDDPKLVGPLIVDYQYVAERTLNAVRRFEEDSA